jgi:hypothetical protein
LRPKPRNRPPMVLWANHQTPRARPGLLPSLLTRPPPCTGSIVHDFVLLISPPCGPHLVPSSTGSLEPSLLVSPSPGSPSRLKTFRARSSPATRAHWAKSQSNTRCQSLITEEQSSIDHRDAPDPQSPPWWVHWQHTTWNEIQRKKVKRKRNKEAQLMTQNQRKAKKGNKPSKAQTPHWK